MLTLLNSFCYFVNAKKKKKKRDETKPPCSAQIEKQSIVGFIVFNAPEDNYHSFVSYFVAQWTHILATELSSI